MSVTGVLVIAFMFEWSLDALMVLLHFFRLHLRLVSVVVVAGSAALIMYSLVMS
jgi:hypothetical protein